MLLNRFCSSTFGPLADWADLDGAALIANDPFKDGLKTLNGKVLLSQNNGIGISLIG